jgi:hypothetical protein
LLFSEQTTVSQFFAWPFSSTASCRAMAFSLNKRMSHSKNVEAARTTRSVGTMPGPVMRRHNLTTFPQRILMSWPGSLRRERPLSSSMRAHTAAGLTCWSLEMMDAKASGPEASTPRSFSTVSYKTKVMLLRIALPLHLRLSRS